MTNEMMKAEQQGALEVRSQVNQIQHLMKEVLQEGEHYGKVPGCGQKPTLLQPGAEKIAYMFHFVPTYNVERIDLGAGHREYEVECTLTHRDTGEIVGGGMGLCSTMESKYRYRNEYNPQTRKKDIRKENTDIADTWNTVLKMAKKRAFVDAVKSTTAASDIFTQDIEDMVVCEPKPDPRKALWAEAAELKKKAIELGAKEDSVEAWMKASITNEDKSPKEKNAYSEQDIKLLIAHLKQNITDLEALKAQPEVVYEADYSDEDIPF